MSSFDILNDVNSNEKIHPDALKQDEMVACLIIGKGFIHSYQKKIEEANEKLKKEMAELGVDPEPKLQKATHKNCGLAYDCIVTHRIQVDEAGFKTYIPLWINGDPPEYRVRFTINSPTPIQMTQDTRWSYSDQYHTGWNNKMVNGVPQISNDILPRPSEITIFEDGKKLFAVSEIPDMMKSKYQDKIDKEKQRQKDWERWLRGFLESDEVVQSRFLETMVARRYALVNTSTDKYELVLPSIGMTFQGKVNYPGKNPYMYDVLGCMAKFDFQKKKYVQAIYNESWRPGDEETVQLATESFLLLKHQAETKKQQSEEENSAGF